MYESFYELYKPPFRLTPDPHFFFDSRTHKRGLAYLRYAVQQGEGFVVITGGPGTGKTELMLNLIEELSQFRTTFAKIVSTNVDSDDLLKLVAVSFGLSSEGLGKGLLLKKLENFFMACARQGRRALLLIDEAHILSAASLLELSMLSNFQLGEKAILQCFLLGQEPLETRLADPGLAQIRQRVIASSHLDPLDETETGQYIKHRLAQAGWEGKPRLHDNAYPLIHKFTGGIPRQINSLCNRLLVQGFIDEKYEIDAGVVRTVIKDMLAETVVAHAPYSVCEPVVASFANSGSSAHCRGQSKTPVTKADVQPRAPAVALKMVDVAAETPAVHAGPAHAGARQERVHDGARRLPHRLAENSQAERELRARIAFFVNAGLTENNGQRLPRLTPPGGAQQHNGGVHGVQVSSAVTATDRRSSSGWKWAAVTGVIVLGMVFTPQLWFSSEPVEIMSTRGSESTNKLTIAAIGPVAMRDVVDSEQVSSPVNTVEVTQNDNSLLMPAGIPLPDVIAGLRAPLTAGSTDPPPLGKGKAAEVAAAVGQEVKKDDAPMVAPLALRDEAPAVSQQQSVNAPSQKPAQGKVAAASSAGGLPRKIPERKLAPEKQAPVMPAAAVGASATIMPIPSSPFLAPVEPASSKHIVTAPMKNAPYEKNRISADSLESSAEVKAGIAMAELDLLLARLTSAYETGNLRKLVGIFAENARSNDRVSLDEIEEDYRKLFNVTDMRRMTISDIQWAKDKGQMRGKGNFQLSVREKGAGRVTSYDGSIRLGVTKSRQGIAITRLDYRYDK